MDTDNATIISKIYKDKLVKLGILKDDSTKYIKRSLNETLKSEIPLSDFINQYKQDREKRGIKIKDQIERILDRQLRIAEKRNIGAKKRIRPMYEYVEIRLYKYKWIDREKNILQKVEIEI